MSCFRSDFFSHFLRSISETGEDSLLVSPYSERRQDHQIGPFLHVLAFLHQDLFHFSSNG